MNHENSNSTASSPPKIKHNIDNNQQHFEDSPPPLLSNNNSRTAPTLNPDVSTISLISSAGVGISTLHHNCYLSCCDEPGEFVCGGCKRRVCRTHTRFKKQVIECEPCREGIVVQSMDVVASSRYNNGRNSNSGSAAEDVVPPTTVGGVSTVVRKSYRTSIKGCRFCCYNISRGKSER